jgi:putative FmdB family regulatory protein
LYELECRACGRFEELYRVPIASGTVRCPLCGNYQARKIIHAPTPIGVLPSKTGVWDRDGGGRCDTNTALRAWEHRKDDLEGAQVLEPGTAARQQWEDKAKQHLHEHARKVGYRSWEHKSRDEARKRVLDAGVDTAKPMV